MRVTYDPEADAAQIYLRRIGPGEAQVQVVVPDDDEMRGEIILDLDSEGRLIGIEVLGARSALPPELLARASPPGISSRVTDDQSLIEKDPASEACFSHLVEVIAWELGARLAVGDPTGTPEEIRRLAALVADSLLDVFEVKQRPADTLSWLPDELA